MINLNLYTKHTAMFRLTVLGLFFVFIFSNEGIAQKKVKYKTLYPELAAGNYKTSESDLRLFLTQEPDFANANLYMAIILRKKMDSLDAFNQKDRYLELLDSAVIFYNKSIQLIDEKEVKKNDQYYQTYNRRDLRTGKMAIKVSDIQLDIENRVRSLNEYKQNILLTFSQLGNVEAEFDKLKTAYENIVNPFDNINQLYLRADATTENSLKQLGIQYDLFVNTFNEYAEQSKKLNPKGSVRSIKNREIKEFKKDGLEKPDFMQEQVALWSYKTWANDALLVVSNEMRDLKKRLADIGKSYQKVEKELKLVRKPDQIKFDIPDAQLTDRLKKYDPEIVMIDILDYQRMRIQYQILSSPVSNPVLRDSIFVDSLYQTHSQLSLLSAEIEKLGTKLQDAKYVKIMDDYTQIINDLYGDKNKLIAEVKAENTQWRMNKAEQKELADKWLARSKWAIYDDKKLPLFTEEDQLPEDMPYLTKALAQNTFKGQYAAGVETDKGVFMAQVNPDKTGKWFWANPLANLDKLNFLKICNDQLNVYLYADMGESDTSFLFYFDVDGNLLWKTDIAVTTPVANLRVQDEMLELIAENGDLILRTDKLGNVLN